MSRHSLSENIVTNRSSWLAWMEINPTTTSLSMDDGRQIKGI